MEIKITINGIDIPVVQQSNIKEDLNLPTRHQVHQNVVNGIVSIMEKRIERLDSIIAHNSTDCNEKNKCTTKRTEVGILVEQIIKADCNQEFTLPMDAQ